MSGQLYRFKFTESSQSVHHVFKCEMVTSVEVAIILVDSGEFVRKYSLQCDSYISCRESLYGLLRRIDAEFARRISFFDRDDYRVKVVRTD